MLMRRPGFLFYSASVISFLGIVSSAWAITFPDVPKSYPHAGAIDHLSSLGIITGNPDGTFRPRSPVNRAAMLKLLYVASGREPGKLGPRYGDVVPGSWYEDYVRDAVAQGFVQGYGAETDPPAKRLFKPDQAVTRAEALKLTLLLLGIPAAELDEPVQMYADVQAADWHAGYAHTALVRGILPIAGQEGDDWHPGWPLERGEAAAYISNALQVKVTEEADVADDAEEAEDMTETDRSKRALKVWQAEEDAMAKAKANTMQIPELPFRDSRTFPADASFQYALTMSTTQVVEVALTITGAAPGGVSCRLFYLPADGSISDEYYLGIEDGKQCFLKSALRPGNWQLRLEPQTPGAAFTLEAKKTTGDGNDGISQAKIIPFNLARPDFLDAGDLEDWYTFAVPNGPPRMIMVRIVSEVQLGCLVYPTANVDLFGFQGPTCGNLELYQPGTYMVAVRHRPPRGVKVGYMIQVEDTK